MPIDPFGSGKAVLIKSPRQGNDERFSSGNSSEEIVAWEVWNSRYKRQVSPHTKIYSDETTCITRTHDKLAAELQSGDSVKFNGYTYSVLSVHPINTVLGINSQDYEVTLK